MKKKTKIVATIGPASRDKETLMALMDAGMNVCRLNFSHSDHEWHRESLNNIRQAAQEMKLPIAIIADLQGPRIRTRVDEELELVEGELVVLCEEKVLDWSKKSQEKFIGIDFPGIISQLFEGQEVMIEDGKIILTLKTINNDHAEAKVIAGGVVKNHKGMNFPGAILDIPPITKKDTSDLAFSVHEGVEYVALSFVGNAEHVTDLKERISMLEPDETKRPKVVVKIEKQDAIDNLDSIIDATDAVMIARGDLATEVGQEKLGVLQKTIIEKSIRKAKPVIVATQMLESMTHNPRPTRAEINDVANAVIDHTDATMLSGESAAGKYPIETVRTMSRIISETESSPFDDVSEALDTKVETQYVDMIRGIYELGRHAHAEAILATSVTGETAELIAHFRPQCPVLVATNREVTYRRLALVWGIEPILLEGEINEQELIAYLYQLVKNREMVTKNDEVACIFRDPLSGRKKVEMVKVV